MAGPERDLQPTPTQAENDAAARGEHVDKKEYDGSPLQLDSMPKPEVPPGELPPGGVVQAPAISSLSPSSAVSGDPTDIVMVVNGSGFNSASVIVMNNYDEPTTYGSESQVSTGVKPSLFVVPAEVPVRVRNGDKVSNELSFSFTEEAPVTRSKAKK